MTNDIEKKILTAKPKVALFDLDDVLFYTNPIFARAEKMGLSGDDLWQYFHEEVHKCPVNGWCRDLIMALKFSGITPVFITARSEEIENLTRMSIIACLDTVNFGLYMRKLGDKRSSDLVKEDILFDKILPRYAVLFALDDDIKNCEMYVKYGIPVLHVMNAEGKADTNIVKYSKTVDRCAFRGDFMHVINRRGFENG